MTAPCPRRDAQKLRFGPWLVNAINSGLYQGLCWTDPARRVFRIPWKHNARKDVTSSDIEIFKVGGMEGRGGHPTWAIEVGWEGGADSTDPRAFKAGEMEATSSAPPHPQGLQGGWEWVQLALGGPA